MLKIPSSIQGTEHAFKMIQELHAACKKQRQTVMHSKQCGTQIEIVEKKKKNSNYMKVSINYHLYSQS